MVKVGELVPVDGVIIKGDTSLDQQAITGEFVPVYKTVSDDVFAGSLNIDGVIQVKTKKDPKESVVQKIIDFVSQAQNNETKTASRIKLFERYYVYVVIGIALLFMIVPPLFHWLSFEEAVYRGIIVLVVGSPCALVASVSPAMLSSLSNAARQRILIKGGTYLEHLNGVNAVVFDKTGTLTTGVPVVSEFVLSDDVDSKTIKNIIYTLESQSNHPLAQSITKFLSSCSMIDDISVTEIPGHGVETVYQSKTYQIGRFDYRLNSLKIDVSDVKTKGFSLVPVVLDQKLIGYFLLKDTIRSKAKDTIKRLKAAGITPIMLTGDNDSVARQIASDIGIDIFHSNCYPEDKVNILKDIKKTYGHVMMVGDGINDAPALQFADIGCAMGSASDVSMETADIVFMNDDISNLSSLLSLGKRFRTITIQNIVFSISIIMILLMSNLFGFLELPHGVIAHEGSTIIVILNSLRLLFK